MPGPVSVTGVDLPVADEIRVLGIVLDRRLTFHKHVSAVARSCNYHTHAIRHIRHLLTTELAQIPSRLLQCCAPRRSKLQHQEAAASAEQCSSDRSRGSKTIPRQPVAEDVTLAARSLFSVAHCLDPAPLKLRPYGAIQIGLVLLFFLNYPM